MCHRNRRECPLCSCRDIVDWHADSIRSFLRCRKCELVFVPTCQHPSPEAEFLHYQTHENDPADPAYRRFLQPAFDAVGQHFRKSGQGLDYGCGPGPALVAMFQEAGFDMAGYDPWFAADHTLLKKTYEFITVTEVAEHFREPRIEFDRLWQQLNDGGLLVIMTEPLPADRPFGDWYYRLDPTHLAFYSNRAFQWLADHLGATCRRAHSRVVVFSKPPAGHSVESDNLS
jgi:hypothetical protein